MTDRLNRILALSKRTGDTIVIHDPTQSHDLVVLPFDQYEHLVSSGRENGDYDEYMLEDMSERELIDKINRDIAIWRSYQELNERDRNAGLIEDQLADEPLPDPFEEDFAHHSDWHHVSDLIATRNKKRSSNIEEEGADPIQTFTPVEESQYRRSVPLLGSFSSDVAAHADTQIHDNSAPLEEETSLDSDDDPIFFEEPIS